MGNADKSPGDLIRGRPFSNREAALEMCVSDTGLGVFATCMYHQNYLCFGWLRILLSHG
jgi:hypothetical protein